jgi:thiamine biosynthesis lipoprotein
MASAASLRRIEAIMGTTFELDLRDPPAEVDPEAIDSAFRWLHSVDDRFSTYRASSDVSRLARGEIAEWQASDDVRLVLDASEAMRRRTDGFFDVRHAGHDGRIDPSGYVKGWALEHASEVIAAGGARNFTLNGGGDILARGGAAPGVSWRIGIRHPIAHDRVAAVIAVSDLSVATSGAYERGGHIVDPHTARPAEGLLSVTVVGPSMAIADAYATAAFAMGRAGATWLARQAGYEGCVITADRRMLTTAGFASLRVHGQRKESELVGEPGFEPGTGGV